jgi:hypothetical protein
MQQVSFRIQIIACQVGIPNRYVGRLSQCLYQRVRNELYWTRHFLWLLSHPPLSRQHVVSLSRLPVCRRSSLLTGEGGGGRGWARSQFKRPPESLAL